MVSSSLSISTHLWANLPLDLLISITKRLLVRSDLLSFRLVCSDWRSALPCPKDLPWYSTWPICMKDGRLYLILKNNEIVHSIPLPFPSDGDNIKFLLSSNGWLLFVNYNYYSYHLFDPVSKQYHMLPPLSMQKDMKRNDINHDSVLHKVVVSRSRNGGVTVAGIVKIYKRTGCFTGCRFSFFEIGKEKSWHISKTICDNYVFTMVGGGDSKRFYALDNNWGLYLLEAGPLMLWRRFNLYLPKHILNKFNKAKSGKNQPHMWCCGLTEVDDGYLEVRGIDVTRISSDDDTLLTLKVHGLGLRICNKDANAYGDGNWTVLAESMYNFDHIFKPRLGSIALGSLKTSS